MSGTVALRDLQRLQKVMAFDDLDQANPIYAELRFSMDKDGLRRITGTLDTQAQMTCQRCLQPAQLEVHTQLSLAVVLNEDQAKALPKDADPWLVEDLDGQADLYQAIEDELLLSLPTVAYHSEQCIDPALYSSGEKVEEKTENPFRVLEKLKGTKSNQ